MALLLEIKKTLDDSGVNQESVAEAIGVSSGKLSKALNGKQGLKPSVAQSLAGFMRQFGLEIDPFELLLEIERTLQAA